MANILILYSTTDGHTREICRRLEQVLEALGRQVSVRAIDSGPVALETFDTIVLGASIRYGRHAKQVYRFIDSHRELLDSRATAFFSVNAVARKAEKNRPETNPYLRKFLRQIDWRPKKLAVFAGKIDYPRYRTPDRLMIRLIMWMTHGPTDPNAVVEFTDWQQVEAFGKELAEM